VPNVNTLASGLLGKAGGGAALFTGGGLLFNVLLLLEEPKANILFSLGFSNTAAPKMLGFAGSEVTAGFPKSIILLGGGCSPLLGVKLKVTFLSSKALVSGLLGSVLLTRAGAAV
jgi:hypothetical protein